MGLEPTICGLEVRRLIHWAKGAKSSTRAYFLAQKARKRGKSPPPCFEGTRKPYASSGNRTRVTTLEGLHSTTEL